MLFALLHPDKVLGHFHEMGGDVDLHELVLNNVENAIDDLDSTAHLRNEILNHLVMEGYEENTAESVYNKLANPETLRDPSVLTARIKTAMSFIRSPEQLAAIGQRTWDKRFLPAIEASVKYADSAILRDAIARRTQVQEVATMTPEERALYASRVVLNNNEDLAHDHGVAGHTLSPMPGNGRR